MMIAIGKPMIANGIYRSFHPLKWYSYRPMYLANASAVKHLANSAGCKLIGPAGEIDIDHGVIAAKRHIHLTPETAAEIGVEDKQIVSVAVGGEGRKLVFGDVIVRVSPNYAPAMHIDTDESNAAGIAGATEGEIIL